jgi:hypothetical protein
MNRTLDSSDLSWSLASFSRPKQAAEYFGRFKGAFSVYSASVKKIYTDYTTEVVTGDEPRLIIQPNMYEFTAMFHNIERDAILRTSTFIYDDSGEMKLSAVLAKSDYRQSFALKEGLFKLFNGDFVDGAFLPIITYGDLKTLPNQNRPILQLHGLQLEGLAQLSEFQKNDLLETMTGNLIKRLVDI